MSAFQTFVTQSTATLTALCTLRTTLYTLNTHLFELWPVVEYIILINPAGTQCKLTDTLPTDMVEGTHCNSSDSRCFSSETSLIIVLKARLEQWQAHQNLSSFNSVSPSSLAHIPPLTPVFSLAPSLVTPHSFDLATAHVHPSSSKLHFTASTKPSAPWSDGSSEDTNLLQKKPFAETTETATNLFVT